MSFFFSTTKHIFFLLIIYLHLSHSVRRHTGLAECLLPRVSVLDEFLDLISGFDACCFSLYGQCSLLGSLKVSLFFPFFFPNVSHLTACLVIR